MSTIVQQAEQLADDRLKKVRWALGLGGLLAIVFAIVIVVWPSISLTALVILFGALALSRGIVGLVMAFRSPIKEGRGWLVLSSLVGIAIGLAVFFFTDMSALALLYVIGAYALTVGILTVFGAEQVADGVGHAQVEAAVCVAGEGEIAEGVVGELGGALEAVEQHAQSIIGLPTITDGAQDLTFVRVARVCADGVLGGPADVVALPATLEPAGQGPLEFEAEGVAGEGGLELALMVDAGDIAHAVAGDGKVCA